MAEQRTLAGSGDSSLCACAGDPLPSTLTQTPADAGFDVLKERHAERWSLEACRGATFVQCLRAFGIAPTIAVSTPQVRSTSIRAIDIYAARKRYFGGLDIERDVHCCMTTLGDKLVDLYRDWLTHDYTGRYRSITSDAHQQWLKRVIILVVARHLMEQKYAHYAARGCQAFADAWACGEMCRLLLLVSLPGEMARLVHHIVRDPEQRQALIDQFLTDLEVRMRAHPLAAPETLPPLPPGAKLPFALLSQAAEGSD